MRRVFDGGWVAMWRPLEVFPYDWWPIRADGRLLQRLSTMPVRSSTYETGPADAWRSGWPKWPPEKGELTFDAVRACRDKGTGTAISHAARILRWGMSLLNNQ